MQVLILRLEAPLMSFGDVAIDEICPTRRLPARSMLTELLANALGWVHRDVAVLDGAASYSGLALRQRHYRADAVVTIALMLVPAEETPDLVALEAAFAQSGR